MTIEILQEITDWGLVGAPTLTQHNGTYWVDKKHGLVAHQPPGGEKVTYEKPMRNFSKTKRKFKKIGEEDCLK